MGETKELNTGTELAKVYAITAMPEVQLSQVAHRVGDSVAVRMSRAAKYVDEDVFCGYLRV